MSEQSTSTAPATSAASKFASAVTGIYGLSGSGKSAQEDEAAIYAWERFRRITLMYVSDLGGWGSRRLSLIKRGIVRVWYMRNHLDPFATMELASLGYWPKVLDDPETGLAAPDVVLVAPTQLRWTLVCKHGHEVVTVKSEAETMLVNQPCQDCGAPTSAATCLRIDKVVVQSPGFKHVGHWGFDSFTQMNDWGLDDLARQGAGMEDGALKSALGLKSGQFTFGTGSMAHVGFLMARTNKWIANIRSIPGQVIPATLTFGVESGRGDDESGGIPIFGPKIAGHKRTSTVPGWVGNLLHASRDIGSDGAMHFRLWFTSHYDPGDPRGIPYLAKPRGTLLGMPNEGYLEDPADTAQQFSQCSIRRFYELLDQQLAMIEASDAERFPDAPGIAGFADDQEEAVVSTQAITQATIAASPVGSISGPTTMALPQEKVGRVVRRGAAAARGRSGVARPPVASVAIPVAATVQTAPAVMTMPAPAEPIAAQLEASLAARAQEVAVVPTVVASPPPTITAPHSPQAAPTRILRRTPRPTAT